MKKLACSPFSQDRLDCTRWRGLIAIEQRELLYSFVDAQKNCYCPMVTLLKSGALVFFSFFFNSYTVEFHHRFACWVQKDLSILMDCCVCCCNRYSIGQNKSNSTRLDWSIHFLDRCAFEGLVVWSSCTHLGLNGRTRLTTFLTTTRDDVLKVGQSRAEQSKAKYSSTFHLLAPKSLWSKCLWPIWYFGINLG